MHYERDTSLGGPGAFPPTRWSVVREAAEGKKPSRDALESVIALYWKPVYKYIRIHWRRSNDDAKDLVQGFFTVLLEPPEINTLAAWAESDAMKSNSGRWEMTALRLSPGTLVS